MSARRCINKYIEIRMVSKEREFCKRVVEQQNFEKHHNTKKCLNVRNPPDMNLKQCSRCKKESDEECYTP